MVAWMKLFWNSYLNVAEFRIALGMLFNNQWLSVLRLRDITLVKLHVKLILNLNHVLFNVVIHIPQNFGQITLKFFDPLNYILISLRINRNLNRGLFRLFIWGNQLFGWRQDECGLRINILGIFSFLDGFFSYWAFCHAFILHNWWWSGRSLIISHFFFRFADSIISAFQFFHINFQSIYSLVQICDILA